MSFYRSESVKHYKLILPRDNAEEIMQTLGENNLIHIATANPPIMNKPFLNQIKRINDCLMKLKDLEDVLSKKDILAKRKEFTNIQYQALFQQWHKDHRENILSSTNFLGNVDRDIEDIWNFYKQASKRIQENANKIQFIRENIAVIKAGCEHFGKAFFADNNRKFSSLQQFQFMDVQPSSQINFKAVVISVKNEISFKRVIFRISRNNCFFVQIPFTKLFEDIKDDEQKNKIVFFLLFSGTKGGFMDKKISKVVSTYCAKDFILPQNIKELQKQIQTLEESLKENQHILTLNENDLTQYFQNIAAFLPGRSFSKVQSYKLYLIKQKFIFNQLNEMQLFTNFIQGDIFIRRHDLTKLQKCLKEIEEKTNYPSGQLIDTKQGNLPTHFVKNSYTNSAQMIVETYGVPRYKQANPSFFTIITFPFLFGVMFGDIAHGLLMMAFGLWLIFKKYNGNNELIKILSQHQYIIFLMGFFSTYCGLIYNDFMSINLNLFGSCYNVENIQPEQPIPRISDQCVYPVGLDPVWAVSTNYLNYMNSLKMKISVIIAVLHMTLGVFIKASNSLYFRRWIDFIFEFIPQLIFLIALFGYMDFLIIYKWLKPWQPLDPNAPSIITTMINLPLRLGKTENCCGGQPMWGTPDNTSQDSIQLFLLLFAAFCIPIMFFPKPLLLIRKQKVKQNLSDQIEQLIEEKQANKQDDVFKRKENHETTGQIFVHQFIETIQYVLGCISNTASYLRLWALSLAHSQLSEVLLSQTVERGIVLGYKGIPLMLIMFPILAISTFGILLCMDSMQCFLHTLRLHWVEFQNKFYRGDGYKFQVFSFREKISQQLKEN